jgi:hypothetical protein
MPATYPLLEAAAAAAAESAGLLDDAGLPIGQETDHAGVGLGKLIYYLQTKARWAALTSAMLEPFQVAEDLLWAVYTLGWDPDTLGGVNLDTLGALVGEARKGRLDPAYRLAVKVRLLINASDGKASTLAEIILTALPDAVLSIVDYSTATAVLNVLADLTNASLSDLTLWVKQAKSAGVRVSPVFSDSASGFIIGTVAGVGASALGVGDVALTVGGDIGAGG